MEMRTKRAFACRIRTAAFVISKLERKIHRSIAVQFRRIEHRKVRGVVLINEKEDLRASQDQTLNAMVRRHRRQDPTFLGDTNPGLCWG